MDEAQFVELCNSCGDCIHSCPTSILVKGRAGFPVVDFSKGECEFCGNCVVSCNSGAIQQKHEPDEAPWPLKAVFADSCVTYQGVICRSCAEQCEVRAIDFKLCAGRVPQPELSVTVCSGCGACVSICPVGAISVIAPTEIALI